MRKSHSDEFRWIFLWSNMSGLKCCYNDTKCYVLWNRSSVIIEAINILAIGETFFWLTDRESWTGYYLVWVNHICFGVKYDVKWFYYMYRIFSETAIKCSLLY